MDPLSVTASVVAVAGLATQSAKAVYKLLDGLVEAPQIIANSKALVAGTQNLLDTLTGTLTTSQDMQARFGCVLQSINLDQTLTSTQELCDKFNTTMTKYTRHSTDARLSNRDRLLVNLHESQIVQFNDQISGCQKTISLVIETIILPYILITFVADRIVSHSTSDDVQQLTARFQAQEQALSTLAIELSKKSTTPEGNTPVPNTVGGDEQASLERFTTLQKACEATLKATQAAQTRQSFRDMQIDQSLAMQGIVGEAQKGVDQTFGK
ncbi:hypothetical protein PG987_009948, partial [Apiospora arundinis]